MTPGIVSSSLVAVAGIPRPDEGSSARRVADTVARARRRFFHLDDLDVLARRENPATLSVVRHEGRDHLEEVLATGMGPPPRFPMRRRVRTRACGQ